MEARALCMCKSYIVMMITTIVGDFDFDLFRLIHVYAHHHPGVFCNSPVFKLWSLMEYSRWSAQFVVGKYRNFNRQMTPGGVF